MGEFPFSTKDVIDSNNNPSEVTFFYTLGNINFSVQLPLDVIIGIDGDKVVAESKILDGVSVFERICRKPFEINFEFTFRSQDQTGKYIFPQSDILQFVDVVWMPDMVIQVKNTFLNNALKIFNVILQPISLTTIRGNTNIIASIKAKECSDSGSYGTLIIPL